jgi:hypothetical protein
MANGQPECPRCHHPLLHLHDYPERTLAADALETKVTIVRYECAACGAKWRILPGFVARHLWRSWDTIEATTLSAPAPSSQPSVPKRTLQRWWSRLLAAAMALVQLFAASCEALLVRVAGAVGHEGTREELVLAYATDAVGERGNRLLAVTALVHRLLPGVRLM